MNVEAVFSFLVHPGKHLEVQPPIGGTRIPLNGNLFGMLDQHFQSAPTDCDIEIAFVPAGNQQNNACRNEILALIRQNHLDQARALAARLQAVTTNRSSLGLLFVMVGSEEQVKRVCIARFPADFGIIAEEERNALRVEFIEKVFMKNAATYKAVVYEGTSLDADFWAGRAIDRQIKNSPLALSGYWIKEFLLSDFRTTSATGTRRLAVAIKDAIDKTTDLDVKEELVGAALLARTLHGQMTSIAGFMERYNLSEAARRELLQHLRSPTCQNDMFEFSNEEYGKHVRYRSLSISSGATIIAPMDGFDDCITKRRIRETDDEYEFSTRGRVVDQRLRVAAR
jgi:hypothetical protein